ncbi:YagK/YfjJ domain-containing protein [Halorhodospira halochloris]|uniref:YagK/YfjJ domain-containing protein n=1 Tax=Halorhodospira halochloris TaxID=1052 RepID=UPI003B75B980
MKSQPKYHTLNKNWRLHYEPYYKGLRVHCDQSNHGPLVENFLENTLEVLERARSRSVRTFAIRFDLYLPNDGTVLGNIEHNSEVLKAFWHNLDRELDNAQLANPPKKEYIWAREVGSIANKTHFHVLLTLNGNSIQSLGNPEPSFNSTFADNTLAHRIIRSWLTALGLPLVPEFGRLVYFQKAPHDGHLITYNFHREDHNAWQHLFYIASYLCKANTKPVGAGQKLRTFGCSRIYRRPPA